MLEVELNDFCGKMRDEGFAILYGASNLQEVQMLKDAIEGSLPSQEASIHTIRDVLHKISILRRILLSRKMRRIVRGQDPKVFLTKSICFDEPLQSDQVCNLVSGYSCRSYRGKLK